MTYDLLQPEDRVGAIAALAASGDSILIDPGTYYEHIPLEGKSLTFIGIAGSSATILDGSRDLPDREGSIIYTLTGVPADLAIEGLTLRGGTGSPWSRQLDSVIGGAICWWGEPVIGSLSIVDCVFEDNSTRNSDHPWEYGGGAIFANGVDDVRVEGCSFTGSATHGNGGDLFLVCRTGSIRNCFFDISRGAENMGASIYGEEVVDFMIQECTFESEAGRGWERCIEANPWRIEILDSRFLDYGPGVAARIALFYIGVGSPRQEVVLSRNLFWNAAGSDTMYNLDIGLSNGDYLISENTFYRCGIDASTAWPGGQIECERNIMARSGITFRILSGGIVRCCDFWRTPFVDENGNLTLSDNLSEDPLFCDEQAGDLRIAFQSPCAAENSPSGCGRIGALDPACDITPARQMSWGNIKALFRGER